MIKVGSISHVKYSAKGKKIYVRFYYSTVKFDKDGWADASEFLPPDYDLVWMRVEGKSGCLSGWITGRKWDGLRLEEGDKVLSWKRKPVEDEEYIK